VIALWVLVCRAVVASSYLTLAVADIDSARALAFPYAVVIAVRPG
jgi:hypothetical protein